MFLLAVKGRCQFVVLEIYRLLHWLCHSILKILDIAKMKNLSMTGKIM